MYSTSYSSSSGSYSVLLPWSGDVSWALLQPTEEIFAVPPWAPEFTAPSAQWIGVVFVPVAHTSARQTRAFSVVGPSVWNGHPLALRLLPRVLSDTFFSSLKVGLFSHARIGSASE